jgi:hypothetical protein
MAQDLVPIIEQDRPMHLARKTNRLYFFRLDLALGENIADSQCSRLPPIARILLSPTRFGRSKGRVCTGRRGGNSTFGVNQHGAGSAGSDINSQKSHSSMIVLFLTQFRGL